MSRSRAATPSEIKAAAEPLSYTALLHDASVQEAPLLPKTGHSAVPAVASRPPSARRVQLQESPALARSRRRAVARLRALLCVTDAVIAVAGVAAAVAVNRPHVAVIPVLWLAMMWIRASRHSRVADLSDLRLYTKLNVNFVLIVTLAAIIFDNLAGTRATLAISAGVAAAGYGVRALLDTGWARQRLRLAVSETVVIVGSLESVARTIAEWENVDAIDIVGVCLSESDFGPEEVRGVPVLGSVADVANLARRSHIDIVAVHDVDKLGGLQLAKLQWALEDVGTQMSVITPMTNTMVERARVRTAGRRLIVDIAYSRPQGVVAFLKGVVDRIIALVALLIASPFLIVAGVLVKVTSKGPVVFKQTRVREHGRTFTMYKLRTMSEDAEDRLADLMELNEVGGGLFKIKNDPRITPVGVWLRRLSIDELPQLWNVVKGDMSLIGPRPALPSEVASYDQMARRRLAVKPGLTGLWQVSGRSDLDWESTVRLDLYYVENWSFMFDIEILARTVRAVLAKSGAY